MLFGVGTPGGLGNIVLDGVLINPQTGGGVPTFKFWDPFVSAERQGALTKTLQN